MNNQNFGKSQFSNKRPYYSDYSKYQNNSQKDDYSRGWKGINEYSKNTYKEEYRKQPYGYINGIGKPSNFNNPYHEYSSRTEKLDKQNYETVENDFQNKFHYQKYSGYKDEREDSRNQNHEKVNSSFTEFKQTSKHESYSESKISEGLNKIQPNYPTNYSQGNYYKNFNNSTSSSSSFHQKHFKSHESSSPNYKKSGIQSVKSQNPHNKFSNGFEPQNKRNHGSFSEDPNFIKKSNSSFSEPKTTPSDPYSSKEDSNHSVKDAFQDFMDEMKIPESNLSLICSLKAQENKKVVTKIFKDSNSMEKEIRTFLRMYSNQGNIENEIEPFRFSPYFSFVNENKIVSEEELNLDKSIKKNKSEYNFLKKKLNSEREIMGELKTKAANFEFKNSLLKIRQKEFQRSLEEIFSEF